MQISVPSWLCQRLVKHVSSYKACQQLVKLRVPRRGGEVMSGDIRSFLSMSAANYTRPDVTRLSRAACPEEGRGGNMYMQISV